MCIQNGALVTFIENRSIRFLKSYYLPMNTPGYNKSYSILPNKQENKTKIGYPVRNIRSSIQDLFGNKPSLRTKVVSGLTILIKII